MRLRIAHRSFNLQVVSAPTERVRPVLSGLFKASCFLLMVMSWSAGTVTAEELVDYETEVKPIFREHCYACHGALKQEG